MQSSQNSSPLPTTYNEGEVDAIKKHEESSLDEECGWNVKLINYQGHWIVHTHLQSIITFQTNFRAQDSDILLVTLPKSGTTWLKAIVFAILNRVQYHPASPQHPLLIRNPHDLVYFDFALSENPDLSGSTNPRIFATHLPYTSLPQSVKDSACKIVYLSRNPKDTFISIWQFLNKVTGQTQAIEQVFEQFCKGRSPYGPYWNHVLGYLEKGPEMHENLFFFKYEDMKKETGLYLKKLAEFLGFPFSIEEEASGVVDEIVKLCSFENLSNLAVNKHDKLLDRPWMENNWFFRHGEIGDWKNFLTEEMVNKIDGLTEENFKVFGLEF